MNNRFFNLIKSLREALIELIKTYKKISFYIALILLGIIFFSLKQYILTSTILAYITEKFLEKYEDKMKLKKIANISLILGIMIVIITIVSKNVGISNIFFLIFSSLFTVLFIFYYIICFLIYYFKYQFQSKYFFKVIKESLELMLLRKENKYSDFFNELINLIFINSLVASILTFFVSLLHKIIPGITEIINSNYILSYFILLIVKSIDYIKEKILEIE